MWRSSNFMTGGRTKSIAWPSSLRTKSYGISTTHFWIRPFSLSRVKDLKTTWMKNTNNLPVRCPWYLRTQCTVFQAQTFFRQMERGVFFQIRLSYHKESCTTSPTGRVPPQDGTRLLNKHNKTFHFKEIPKQQRLKIWEPRRYRPFQMRLHLIRYYLKVYLLLFTVTFCLTSQSFESVRLRKTDQPLV